MTTAEEVLSIPDIKVFKIIVSHDDGPTYFKPVREHIDQAHPNLVVTSAFYTDLEINHKDAQKRHCGCSLCENTWLIDEANFRNW